MGKASRKKQVIAAPSESVKKNTATALTENRPFAWQQTDSLLCATIFLAVLAVYIVTLCPTIFTSGAGENVTAVATLGVPHPPGFPLYCLLGRAFVALVPFGSIAFRVNLFAAFCGSAAAVVLFIALRMTPGIRSRAACVCAALLFAFSRTFWSQAVIAEVYTLNALLLCSILLAINLWQRGFSVLPVPLLAGLGLTIHPLQLLFFPAWFLLIFRSPRKDKITRSEISIGAILFVATLSLHLYPFLRSKANPPLDWGNPETLKNLVAYLTASQYRERMFSLGFGEVLINLKKGLMLLSREFSPVLIPLPLIGAWIAFRTARTLLLATLIAALMTLLYAVNYNIPWEIDVYYIPIVLVLAIWSCFGIDAIHLKLPKAQSLLVILAVIPLAYNFSHNDRTKNRIALAYGRDILRTCPRGSHLILPGTDAAFSLLYLTTVEKQRPDLHVWVSSGKELNTLRDGVNPDAPHVNLLELVSTSKVPVFQAQRVTAETLPGYQQIPYGVLFRLLPKTDTAVRLSFDFNIYELEKYISPIPDFHLDERNRVILANYLIMRGDSELAQENSTNAKTRYEQAEQLGKDLSEIRSQLGMRFLDLGDTSTAIAQLQQSLAVVEDASVYNRLGRLYAQTGRADEAMSMFLRAIELDPNLAIAHSNLGALFGMKRDYVRAMQELELALRLDPKSTLARNNLARVYALTGNIKRGIEEFQRSLQLDPNQSEIRKELELLQSKSR